MTFIVGETEVMELVNIGSVALASDVITDSLLSTDFTTPGKALDPAEDTRLLEIMIYSLRVWLASKELGCTAPNELIKDDAEESA